MARLNIRQTETPSINIGAFDAETDESAREHVHDQHHLVTAQENRFAAEQINAPEAVPGDQAPVRLDEGEIPRTGEEHRAPDHAVRAVESVDGATTTVGDDRVIASAIREMTRSESPDRCVPPKISESDAHATDPMRYIASGASSK